MQAFTKNDMKPRRTPLCFFSNASRYSLRSAIAADMSTSLKVVSMAAVFWASFSRAAMVRRRRVIFTRSSRPRRARAGRRRAGGGRCGGWARAAQEGEHVALGDAAVLAGASAELRRAETLLLAMILAAAGNGAWPAREPRQAARHRQAASRGAKPGRGGG